jgi:hypothetical protein
MKRVLQLVVLVTVSLLAAQPALAGLPCAQAIPAASDCAPGCGMAMNQGPMSQMGMDCQMSWQAPGNCGERNCCSAALPQLVAHLSSVDKSRDARTIQFVPALQAVVLAGPVFAVSPPVDPVSAAPAKYVLFHVFRI